MAESALTALRSYLSQRLVERRAEIEADVHVRMHAVSDPGATANPAYVQGLSAALSAAFDYALAGLAGDDEGPVSVTLLAQARLAARSGVSLDTVLRRYFAGYTLFTDFLMQEAVSDSFSARALQQLMRAQAARFDRLVAAITDEHSREWSRRPSSAQERRKMQVEGLLEGELMVGEELDYDLRLSHLGLIVTGPGPEGVVRRLALDLDCRLLLVRPDEGTVWAWLGAPQPIDPERVRATAETPTGAGPRLALGEPAHELSGWRLTHRQAKAASAVGARSDGGIARYRDVAMVASILGDDLFGTSLRELFLVPLERGRNGGVALLATLRAYFAADRNVSSAAAALGVSRQTVINRLNVVEGLLGRPLSACAPEVEAALRLDQFERAGSPGESAPTTLAPIDLQPAKLPRTDLDRSPTRPAASV